MILNDLTNQFLGQKSIGPNGEESKTDIFTYPLNPLIEKLITDSVVIPVTISLNGSAAQTADNYGVFFTADNPYVVIGVTESHGSAATNGTLQIETLKGTAALDSGSNV